MNKRYLNQLIIFGYLTLLLLHFLIGRRYSMYPSLVFPSFSQAPPIKDNIQYPDVTLYAVTDQNKIMTINKESFFKGYKKHVNYFLGTIITNENRIKHKPALTKARAVFLIYSLTQLKKLYPKESFMRLLITKTIKSYSTKRKSFNKDISNGPLTLINLKK